MEGLEFPAMKKAPLPPKDRDALFADLESRFESHPSRHPGLAWTDVLARLEAAPAKLWSLSRMEATGGEPDVVALDKKTGELTFMDCSPETPAGRVSLCYDREAWESRKEHRPANTVLDLAAEMGVQVLDEEQYTALQKLGEFDQKRSSWILTPPHVRAEGDALYCTRRHGRIYVGYNGAQSYYNSRGFRALLRV